ncbi:hypothetical protein [Anaerorhabdus sp.]|uniref:hypothetical protein n=1 Tax=Anaerorhabdus sp. TaxID=1872524 RepID=UPI002FC85A19
MSVDYKQCDCCNKSYYEEHVGNCNECGHFLCTNCLVNKGDLDSKYAYDYGVKYDGTKEQIEEYGIDSNDYRIGEIIDDTGIDSKYCPFCNGLKVHNDDLLKFAIKKLNTSYYNLTREYLEEFNNENH